MSNLTGVARSIGRSVQKNVENQIKAEAERQIEAGETTLHYVSNLHSFTMGFAVMLMVFGIVMEALLISGLAYNEPGDKELIHLLSGACFIFAAIYLVWYIRVRSRSTTMTQTGIIDRKLFKNRYISYEEISSAAKLTPIVRTIKWYLIPNNDKPIKINVPNTYIADDFVRRIAKLCGIQTYELRMHGKSYTMNFETK